MHALLIAVAICVALVAAANVLAQGAVRPQCDGACGVIQSIVPVTERQHWTPLGAIGARVGWRDGLRAACRDRRRRCRSARASPIKGMVVLGAAGGAAYAQKPNEYRRQRWDVTLKMDSGPPRVVSLSYEPLFVQEGDYVRVSGNNLELVNP